MNTKKSAKRTSSKINYPEFRESSGGKYTKKSRTVSVLSAFGSDGFTPRDLEDSSRPLVTASDPGQDRFAHEVSILMTEWAISGADLSPTQWLREIKGYSASQSDALVLAGGKASEWKKKRNSITSQISEKIIKRHVDLLVEMQDTFIKASKLGLANAVKQMSEPKMVFEKDPLTGKIRRKEGLSPKENLDCLNAIKSAQEIYRKALGLGECDGGLQEVLTQLERVKQEPTIQKEEIEPESISGVADPRFETLTYDDIFDLVEFRREQKRMQQLENIE